MKKLILIVAALILLAVAGVTAWQVYMPAHEDNVSANTYEDLRQFVRVPAPDPATQPNTSSSPELAHPPFFEPELTFPPTPQVDFECSSI